MSPLELTCPRWNKLVPARLVIMVYFDVFIWIFLRRDRASGDMLVPPGTRWFVRGQVRLREGKVTADGGVSAGVGLARLEAAAVGRPIS